MFDLKNKVAVITGASGVLASSVIKSLALAGVHLVLLSRNKESLRDLEKEISKFETKVLLLECDILSKGSLIKVRDSIINHFGRIDMLLNIAGGNLPGATVGPNQQVFDMALEDFNTVVELNLNGTLLPCLVFGEVMTNQKNGTIINYSSMAAQRTITRVAGYSASKAAMENFTKWLAVEMATKFGEGIRVNAIAPGFFIGKQNKDLLLNKDGSYTERGKKIIENTPMGRFGEAEELNGAVHFLCSEASKFITGIVLPIDGGFNAFSGV